MPHLRSRESLHHRNGHWRGQDAHCRTALNSTEITCDIAALTNADILKRILNVPLVAELGESLTELPVE